MHCKFLEKMVLFKICIIFSLTIFSLFFTFYTAFKNKENGKGKWLALSFGAIAAVNFVEASFYFPNFKTLISNYVGVVFYAKETLEFLILPTFYLYLSFYYKKSTSWQKHLAPYIIMLIGAITYYIFRGSAEALIKAECHRDLWANAGNLSFNLGLTAQVSVYGLLSYNLINALESEGFPFRKWHFILLFTLLGIRLITITDNLISVFFAYQDFQIFLYILAKMGILCGLFSLIFWELKYGFATNTIDQVKQKYQSSGLSNSQVIAVKNEIEKYFEGKPFLEADFNLDKMATDIGISKTYLSQVINQEYGLNFRELINKLRVETSLIYLSNNPEMNINEIYYEVGFNSKSVFNSAFKKQMDCTPTEYRLMRKN